MPISTPDKIITPWATSGLKDDIPENADPINGRAGFDLGFPPINLTPKTAGGIPPFGQDFNGIFFNVTQAIQFLQAGGSFPYDGTWAASVGGYPIGALVSRTDSQGLWRNTVANNLTDPEAGGAGWQPEGSGATTVSMSSSNVTLTPLQAAAGIIIITGTLTSNLQLILPQYVKQWVIKNSTSGSFSITVKTASGSGVVAPQGLAIPVSGDGVNIVGVSSQQNLATESSPGIIEIATQAETNAKASDQAAVTPLKLGNGITYSYGAVSYRKSPPWIDGGSIEAWGTGITVSAGLVVVSMPLAMANVDFDVQVTSRHAGLSSALSVEINSSSRTTSTFTVYTFAAGSGAAVNGVTFQWRAIGKAP